MYRIFAHYEAYHTDRKGVKSIQKGIVRLETPDDRLYGANLYESVRLQVTRQYPELQSCPILLTRFCYEEQEDA